MSVNTQRPNLVRQPVAISSGQRLYLREDELDLGLSMIFDAASTLKATTAALRAHHALTWTQAHALSILSRGPQGVLGLSKRLDVTKQAAIKTAQELTLRGFITYASDPRDARRRNMILTESGAVIARDVSAQMRHLLASAYRKVGGDGVAGCDGVLTAITTPTRAQRGSSLSKAGQE